MTGSKSSKMATSSDACPSTPSSTSTGTETELARLEAPQYSYGTTNTNASVMSTVLFEVDIGPAGSTYLKYRKRHACAF